LRQHIFKGYTINKNRIAENYQSFLKAVDEVKKLLPSSSAVDAGGTLELIKMFASTWFSLDAYDTSSLPQQGLTKKQVDFASHELETALQDLKKDLLKKKLTTNLFATERSQSALAGIVGNVFQSFDRLDLYSTIEEKAAHLLYFVVKNHPFIDGNKRSGAFSFIWFLKRAALLNTAKMTPEALTALTLLVAESKASEKERMIGLILMLLNKK
jgi:prophage maintenance system killer protein